MNRFNLSKWAVEHPALVGFLIALIFAAGSLQFFRLGRAEDPSFTLKEMIVAGSWPGATAEQMQAQVADPIERKLRSVESVDYLQTYCVEGGCVTQLALRDDTPKARVPIIWQQVRRVLKDLEPSLPAGAGLAANDDYSDVYGYVFMLTGRDNAALVRQAERIREEILRLPGASKVEIAGEIPRRLYVEFDPRRLAGVGVSPGQLARALARRSAVTPAGTAELGLRTPVRVGGAVDGVQAVEDSYVQTASGVARIGDLARVDRGYADPPLSMVRHGGEPAVVLSVAMAPGADGLAFGKALRQTADRLGAGLPAGVKLAQVQDQSLIIQEAVGAFLIKFFCALSVVLVVAFLTLGLRTGVVVALSVPLTLAAVALFMGAAGIGLQRISLGALILSLGLLVDDAIISVEAMVVQMEKGASRAAAAAYAWTHTAFPMLTGTLLTVVGFLPVGFAQSTTSEYADDIFWVTGAALVFSWIVAVVFTPYLGVKLLPDPKPHATGTDLYDTPLYRRLRGLVQACVDHRRVVVAATAGLLLLSLAGELLVRQQFFPPSDRPEIIVDLALRPGASILATSKAAATIEASLKNDPDVAQLDTFVGEGAPRFYLPYGPTLPNPATATVVVVAKDLEARERLIERLSTHTPVPEAKVHVRRLSLGPSTGFPVQYRVIGPDAERLRDISERVARVLRDTPGAMAVQINWGERIPTRTLQFDPARLARLGADRAGVADALDTVLSGRVVGEVLDGDKRVAMVLRGEREDRQDPGRLATLPVETAEGAVPLDQLARVGVGDELPIAWRRNSEPAMTVQADMVGEVQASEIVERAKDRLAAIGASLPEGYRIEVGGDEELSAKANKAIYDLLPATLAIMLLLLMVQLQSLGRTALVLMTAPLGLVGAIAALLITGAPFGFVALLGLIALAGMIMRNSIILVDQVERNRADGMGLCEAIVEATIGRSRPVVLTALAAVLAFIPLCFNIFWGPMAIVMIGGLLGATALTLLALPALYALVFDRKTPASEDPSHG